MANTNYGEMQQDLLTSTVVLMYTVFVTLSHSLKTEHMVEPSPKVVHPLAHGVQDVEALDDENVPGGQGVHEEEDVAPVSTEYLPATQPMHTRYEAGRNDPAGHFGHSVDGP